MTDALIQVRRHNGVGIVTLSDPERLNPVSIAMAGQLLLALRSLRADTSVRAVLLTGQGRAFSAGGDLTGIGTPCPLHVRIQMTASQELVRELVATPLPVVIAVNGDAAGAGFALALAGDILVAAEQARFIPAFGRIGAVPDMGMANLLQRSIGMHRALQLLMTGEQLTATAACELGLVASVVSAEALADHALALAERLARGPTAALGLTKSLVRLASQQSWEGFLDAEANAQAIAFSTVDFQEGVGAFLEKRKPNFQGH